MTVVPSTQSKPAACSDDAVGSDGALRWQIVERLDQLNTVQAAWLALRERSGSSPPNADPERFVITTGHLGGDVRPYIALLREGAQPKAIVIGRQTKRRVHHRIGYLHLRSPQLRCFDVVYGGLLTDGSDTAVDGVAEHLKALLRRGVFGHVMINHLPAEHPLVSRLQGLVAAAEPHWQMTLVPTSYDATMQHHSSKHRKKLRRYRRLLWEAFANDVELRVYSQGKDVDEYLSVLSKVVPETYQHRLGLGQVTTTLRGALLRLEASRGRLRAFALIAGGKPIAFQTGAVYDGCYYCDGRGYLPAHRELRPGNVLSDLIVQNLASCGCTAIDYGFGDADYKQVYGTHCTLEVSLGLYSNTVPARCALGLDRLLQKVSRSSSGSHLADAIKRVWRRRARGGMTGE